MKVNKWLQNGFVTAALLVSATQYGQAATVRETINGWNGTWKAQRDDGSSSQLEIKVETNPVVVASGSWTDVQRDGAIVRQFMITQDGPYTILRFLLEGDDGQPFLLQSHFNGILKFVRTHHQIKDGVQRENIEHLVIFRRKSTQGLNVKAYSSPGLCVTPGEINAASFASCPDVEVMRQFEFLPVQP